MMRIQRLDNGNLIVPFRAESEDGVIGDGFKEITPDDPEYPAWLKDWNKQESQRERT